MCVCVCVKEKEVRLVKKFKGIRRATLCVCSLRQVLHSVLDLIKSSVRRIQEAGRARPWRKEREGEDEGALTFFYMLKLMDRNKDCHHSFSPLSVPHTNTHTHAHTHTRTHIQMCPHAASCPCKCRSEMSPLSLCRLLCVVKVKVFVIAESQPSKCSRHRKM